MAPPYTRRRLGGRHPLWGMGVTSLIAEISRPAAWSERIAASRPAPGPLTQTSTRFMPWLSASRALASAATWAANGVLLREPLKPTLPELAQVTTAPSVSVMVMIVLLKLACTWATPLVPTLRSRFFAFFTSATCYLLRGAGSGTPIACHLRRQFKPCSPALRAGSALALLPGLRLLAADRHLLRTLTGARVRLRALPMHRQPTPVAQPPVSADVHEALDVHRMLAAERAFDLVL